MLRRRDYLRLLSAGSFGGIAGCLTTSAPNTEPLESDQPMRRTPTETPTQTDTESRPPSGTVDKIAPEDGGDWFQFGFSVSIDGTTALVGARYGADSAGKQTGTAYVFEWVNGGWERRATLTAENRFLGQEFGQIVALDGDIALVGTKMHDRGRGVFVFQRRDETWRYQAKLDADTVDAERGFGRCFAVNGGTICIGGRTDDGGVVYVFERSGETWTRKAVLEGPNDVASRKFGAVLALTDERVLVGAPVPVNADGQDAGAGYLFERSGGAWRQEAELVAADTEHHDSFGSAVGLSGETAVIGAHRDEDSNDVLAGSAYVFSRSGATWEEQAKLAPEDGTKGDHFGRTLAISGNTILFGTDRDADPNGKNGGSAYVFERTDGGWREQAKLVPDDGDAEDKFGAAVDIDGQTALVGAFFDEDPNGEGSGSAYVFQL